MEKKPRKSKKTNDLAPAKNPREITKKYTSVANSEKDKDELLARLYRALQAWDERVVTGRGANETMLTKTQEMLSITQWLYKAKGYDVVEKPENVELGFDIQPLD